MRGSEIVAERRSLPVYWRRLSCLSLALVALLACSCGKSSSKSENADPAPADPTQSAAAAASGDVIWLSIDGRRLASINPNAFRQNTELREIPGVPKRNTWKQVTVTDGGKRSLFIPNVKQKYPGHSVRLYESKQAGKSSVPSIGVFPPAATESDKGDKADQAARKSSQEPVVKLHGVATIDILTQAAPAPGPAPPAAQFRLERAGVDAVVVTLGDKQPTATAPGDDPSKGWELHELLGAHIAADASPALKLIAGDDSVEVPAGILRDKGHVLFLKLNRKGLLRFRWYEGTGEDAVERGELRGVELVKAL